jgi:hypothetical protein
MTQQSQEQQIQVKADDVTLKGMYSNTANILHTKEEFVLDFLSIFPPTGTLNARIIVSPGHMKRMVAAMSENLKIYESQFGEVVAAAEIPKSSIGFEVRQ